MKKSSAVKKSKSTPQIESQKDPISVLIVDDDPEIRDTLARFFLNEGCHVVEAENAAEALIAALEETFTAILTDFNMPVDSGVKLLEKISRFRPLTKVYIMTGAVEVANDENVKRYAKGFFQKPFHPKAVVEQVLNSKKKKK